jgi:hypothetical protein
MEKSGIDYFRQLLGMGPEQGGIISLQDLREPAPVYHSAVARAVDALPMEKGAGEQMLAMISKSKGVKPEEMQWTGLADFLQNKESVTKQEIQNFVDANRVQIGEVTKHAKGSGRSNIHIDDEARQLDETGIDVARMEDHEERGIVTAYEMHADEVSPSGLVSEELEKVLIEERLDYSDPYRGKLMAEDVHQQVQEIVNAEARFWNPGRTTLKPDIEFALAYFLKDPEGGEQPLRNIFGHYGDPSEFNDAVRGVGEFAIYSGEGTQIGTAWDLADAQHQARTWLEQFSDAITNEEGWGRRGDTRYGQYTLPGGTNYREVLLSLDNDLTVLAAKDTYQGPHWAEPNVLAHMRLNDRTGPNDEKILFIEEIQSDWHREGRKKGYRETPPPMTPEIRAKLDRYLELEDIGNRMASDTPREMTDEWRLLGEELQPWLDIRIRRVPDAPLKKNWYETAFRRVLRMAAEGGYDSVAWTPGEVQANRYNLSREVSKIEVTSSPDGTFDISAYGLSGNRIQAGNFEADKLDYVLGAELADKVRQQEEYHVYEGGDLKLGGEKLKSFYDGMIKNYASKFGKKFNAKVGTTKIDTDFDPEKDDLKQVRWRQVWNLPITPKMKEELLTQGIQTFAHGGFVDKPLYERTL